MRILLVTIAMLATTAATGVTQNWVTPANLSNSPNVFSVSPSTVIDSQGKAHVVYVDFPDGGAKTIFYTNNDTADGHFITPSVVSIPGYWLYISQLMLTRTSDDTLHLAVTAKPNGRTEEVALYLSKPANGAWSAPTQLTPAPEHFTYCQSIVALPDDSVLMLYLDEYSLISRTRSPSGTWGAEELHYAAPVDRHYPNGWARAIGSDLYLSYDIPFETYGGCYYRVRRGGVWSAWTRLSSYNAQTASRLVIAKSPTTGELCAIYGYDTGDGESFGSGNLNFDIYARFSADDGQTWTTEARISPGNSLDRWASCVYDAAGNLHVVWTGQVKVGDYGSLLYRKRTADGAWQPVVNVSNNAGRTSTAWEPIRISGSKLHLVYSNSGNPSSGPGYEDVWYSTMSLPADPTPPGAVIDLTATAGEERVTLSWRNPPDSDLQSIVVRHDTSGYPVTPSSGDLITEQQATPDDHQSFLVIPLTPDLPHYFSVFAKDTSGNFSGASQVSAVPTVDVTPPAAPAGFAATPDYTSNITLNWTDSTDPDLKGTVVRVSAKSYPATPTSGTLVTNQPAAPGTAQSCLITGVPQGVTCYFSAFSYDAKPNYSAASHALAVTEAWTVGAVKRAAEGTQVALRDKVVTAIFASDWSIYVEDASRAAGIRVAASGAGLVVGDRVTVTGTMSTRVVSSYPSERQISSAVVTKTSSGVPLNPIALSCASLGGAAAPGVPGVRDAIGANNMGLLVRIAGKVTKVLGNYVFVDDGSRVGNVSAAGPEVGVMVRCPSAPGVVAGAFVSATGIIEGSIPSGWTANRRYLRLRDITDLRVL